MVNTVSVPYEDAHLVFPVITRVIYAASESDPDFTGYSYATEDENGRSNVVFATGANSVSELKKAINSIYGSDVMKKMSEKYMQRDKLDKSQNNSQKNPVSLEQQSKSEIETSDKQEDFVLSADVSDEERKLSINPEIDDSSLEYQALLQKLPFVHVPYPAFRANFLNLQFPTVLSRYHVPPNTIQSQYYSHNPYAHLKFPLHNFDLYNPSIPLFYQAPIAANQVPVDNLNYVSIAIKNTTKSMKENITDNSKTTVTQSAGSAEFNMIESKSNFEPIANKVEKASSSEPALSMFESITISNSVNEETTTEFAKPTVKSRKCGDQIVKDEVSNTEPADTEVTSSTKEPSTETSTISTSEI